MFTIKSLLIIVLSFPLFSGISLADTFVVTNLNDPGAGSLRQAIINSNLNPGPDEIVFEEGLFGTIFLNVGPMTIQDDLTIKGPGGGQITIDADSKSPILNINDGDDERNRIVNIKGLRFINGFAGNGSGIDNSENLTVNSCQFLNGKGGDGAAIYNRGLLSVDSCLFENNIAEFARGGAIFNEGIILSINNSDFRNNQADSGGAISNYATIELIKNSTFAENSANFNNESSGGAIQNATASTINEISHCTFQNNIAIGQGGAIQNGIGSPFVVETAIIKTLVNSTFVKNIARSGGAISNAGLMNISFTTIAENESDNLGGGGGILLVPIGIYQIHNSIIAFNSPSNCAASGDIGGNYSNDFSCGFTGDGSIIMLGPLAHNGGPTETMALLGGDPVNGATINCDALDENGNPTGIPIGVDQRYFPRPFGVRCDSGAFESQPVATVTITKVTDPSVDRNFRFGSGGFNPLQECPLDGGGDGVFVLSDGQSISCNVPQGNYSINEIIPQEYELLIFCIEAPDNIVINNETGDINFTIEDSGSDIDCIYTNIKKGSGGGGCTLASGSNNSSLPLFLLIPVLIMIRRILRNKENE